MTPTEKLLEAAKGLVGILRRHRCMFDIGSVVRTEIDIAIRDSESVVAEFEAKEWIDGIACPFCQENGFDKPGLKSHLSHGDCEVYDSTGHVVRVFG